LLKDTTPNIPHIFSSHQNINEFIFNSTVILGRRSGNLIRQERKKGDFNSRLGRSSMNGFG
jgi:hypothetical protein